MRISAVLERIRAECPGFTTVEHGLTSAADGDRPAAYLQPLQVQAGPNIYEGSPIGIREQRTDQRWSVYIVLDRVQDGTADYGAADQLDDLRAELQAALVGWNDGTDPGADVFAYGGGRLEEYREGIVAWREDFDITIHLTFGA